MRKLRHVEDVVALRLCLGCGACRYIAPEEVELVDVPEEGIRPRVKNPHSRQSGAALDVCPVVRCDYGNGLARDEFSKKWGPVLELWEGYAGDPQIRFEGSSGGVLTALAAYCLERLGMSGVLHIGQDAENPLRNRAFFSRSRAELMHRTGSRYAPASVCDHLEWVETAPAPAVIIGRPVEIAAVRNAIRLRPLLGEKVGLMLSFFCAESPSLQGTIALLEHLGVRPETVGTIRYRGRGWPGCFTVIRKGESEPCCAVSYRQAWGFLQAYRPWGTHLWPDGTGELADISCGDPWYEEPDGINPGFSLVIVRTERGREILHGAMAAGYLELKPAESWKLAKAQGGLLQKKGAVWGRRLAMRIFGLPVTEFRGLDLFHCWLLLSWKDKIRSIIGTIRRMVYRGYYRPQRR